MYPNLTVNVFCLQALQAFNRALGDISPTDSASFVEATQGLLSTSISLLESYIEEGVSKTNLEDVKYFVTQLFDTLARATKGAPAGQAPNGSDQVVKVLQQLLQANLAKLNRQEKQALFRRIQERCSQVPRSVRERFKIVAFGASLDLGEALLHDALSDFDHGRWAEALSIIKSYESAIIVAVEYEEKLDLPNKRAKYLLGGQCHNTSFSSQVEAISRFFSAARNMRRVATAQDWRLTLGQGH